MKYKVVTTRRNGSQFTTRARDIIQARSLKNISERAGARAKIVRSSDHEYEIFKY